MSAHNATDDARRRPLYAKIAIARKQLPELDDETYRDMLENHFGTRNARELNFHQLSRVVQMLAEKGAVFISKSTGQNAAPKPPKSAPHARSDYYHIADDEFGPMKRMISAIWKRLGYDMTSLDTRCEREFGVPSFAWLRDRAKLKRLLTDMQQRERAFDADQWDRATQAERG